MPPFKLFHPLDDTPFWNVRSDVSEILILQSFCYRSYIFFQTLDPAFFRIRYPTDFEPDVLLFRIWHSAYQDVRILRFGYQILFPLFRQFPIHFFQISDPVSFLMWNPAVFFIKILSFPFRYGCFVSEIRIFYSADTKSYLCRSAAFFLEINTSFFRNAGSVFRSNQDILPSDRKPCNIFCLNMISRFRMFFVCSVLTADLLSVLNRSSFACFVLLSSCCSLPMTIGLYHIWTNSVWLLVPDSIWWSVMFSFWLKVKTKVIICTLDHTSFSGFFWVILYVFGGLYLSFLFVCDYIVSDKNAYVKHYLKK